MIKLKSELEKKRLAWRCRRGMLELDIVLQKFIESNFASLSEAELIQFNTLLDYPDNDFWSLVSTGKIMADNNVMNSLLTKLRSTEIEQLS